MIVRLPFLGRFEKTMREGRKTCTARRRRHGEPGDYFVAFGVKFLILSVQHIELSDVANVLWEEEGAASPDEFRELWSLIHPVRGFRPNDKVWVHRFVRAEALPIEADMRNMRNIKGGPAAGFQGGEESK